jgi:replicative DNA helicase
MLVQSTLGLQFIAAIVSDGTLEAYAAFPNVAHVLTHAPAELAFFEDFAALVVTCGKIPGKETVEKETGCSLPVVSEPPEYYWKKLRERHIHRTLVISSEEASSRLKKHDPQAALEVLTQAIGSLHADAAEQKAVDFKDSADTVMKMLAKKLYGDDAAVEFGWPTLDEMSSGMTAGDVISFAGRPGSGKTYMMLHSALHVWRVQKRPVVFVSLEMSPEVLMMRLTAMVAAIPFEWIRTGGIPTFPQDHKKKVYEILKKFQDDECSFKIVDANLAGSAKEIEALCQRYYPSAVFVDAAYMLSVEGRFGKWEKVGEACRELKRLAVRQNVPVVASWQLNRESTKTNVVGLQHLAGSDEISQLSSVVLGLFEEENISNANRRKINILKGRHGEQGSFLTHWCFQTMNFAEVDEDFELQVI